MSVISNLKRVVRVLFALQLGALACASKPGEGSDEADLVTATAVEEETSAGEPLGCEQEAYFGACGLDVAFRATAFDTCLDVQESVYFATNVFDALTGDTPVAFWIEMGSIAFDSDCGYMDEVLVIGDGTAVMRRVGGQFGEASYSRRVEIKPSSFFDECRSTTDPTALTNCLREWFVLDTCIAPLCCPVGDKHPCE